MNTKKPNISRRNFLKKFTVVGATTAATLVGCRDASKQIISGSASHGDVPVDKMTYRTSNSGDRVSLLGYGCMRWPTKPDPNNEDNKIIDQDGVNHLVDYALAHGVNYFDTAPPYCQGASEKATGIALSRHPRNSYFLATKMSNQRFAGQGLSPKQMFDKSVEMYRNSFSQLQTDYFDYYLMHIVGMGDDSMAMLNERFFDNGLLDFLLREREQGRIRNLGFSYHGDVRVFDYLLSRHDEFKWDFVQIQLNYVDYRHASGINFNAEYLYNELNRRNIPVVVMEPLLGGRLASMPEFLIQRLKSRRPDDSIAAWAFRFCGTFPRVLTVLSGMTYMEHLQDNIRTYSPLDPCTDEELALLEENASKFAEFPLVPCTACQYCMPCPYGVNIPAIFSHYNKCLNEGNVVNGSDDSNYARARRVYLVGYDRSVPKLRQASHCIGCGKCMPHCPQSIAIPDELHRIDAYVESLRQERFDE